MQRCHFEPSDSKGSSKSCTFSRCSNIGCHAEHIETCGVTMAPGNVKTVQPNLLDLLHAVPGLVDVVSTYGLKSLAATSRSFRQKVQQQFVTVRIKPYVKDTQEQLKGTLPLLSCGAWKQVQNLHITLSLLPPTAMHTVLQADWPVMTVLDLQNTALSCDAIFLLVAQSWPCLSRLNLNGTSLSTDACLKLLTGSWPLLKSLDLGQNHLDTSFFKQMVEGSRLLYLTELHLPDTGLDTVSEFIHFRARLQTLCLDKNRLTASIMTLLSQADWGSLEVLSIWRCQRLSAETIQVLACTELPRLTNLNMGELGIVQIATHIETLIKLVSQANWPLCSEFAGHQAEC